MLHDRKMVQIIRKWETVVIFNAILPKILICSNCKKNGDTGCNENVAQLCLWLKKNDLSVWQRNIFPDTRNAFYFFACEKISFGSDIV